jgi:hypothetical protein
MTKFGNLLTATSSTTISSLPVSRRRLSALFHSFCLNAKRKLYDGFEVVDELIDGNAIKCRPLTTKDRQIRNFVFWHDRLVMLKQVFDEADPKTVRQWWSDRRKPVQWFNFWFAVALLVGLTVFFGLVWSIEGAIQVYKAYHPSQ